MGQNTTPVTDASFGTDVLQADVPVLVDFWAEWCGPCRLVAPVLEEIAAEHGDKIKVVKLNIDENPQATRTYGVMSIPSLILFKGGQEVARVIGAKPKDAILRDLDLRRPIYQSTASYGHFGREDAGFTWERTDKADALRAAAGLATPASV